MDWLKKKAKDMKTELVAIYLAVHNPGTGLCPKILAGVALGYALSPIDLIPDFIPILGLLDDLLIVPLLLWLAVKLIPDEVMQQARNDARSVSRKELPLNWFTAILFFVVQLALGLILLHFLLHHLSVAENTGHITLTVAGVLATTAFLLWAIQYQRKHDAKAAVARQFREHQPLLSADSNPADESISAQV